MSAESATVALTLKGVGFNAPAFAAKELATVTLAIRGIVLAVLAFDRLQPGSGKHNLWTFGA